jgi:hypothetical protein
LKSNLAQAGITDYSEEDFNALVDSLSHDGEMTPVARYRGGHVFYLEKDMSALQK